MRLQIPIARRMAPLTGGAARRGSLTVQEAFKRDPGGQLYVLRGKSFGLGAAVGLEGKPNDLRPSIQRGHPVRAPSWI
jgi:hypothetical protein